MKTTMINANETKALLEQAFINDLTDSDMSEAYLDDEKVYYIDEKTGCRYSCTFDKIFLCSNKDKGQFLVIQNTKDGIEISFSQLSLSSAWRVIKNFEY